MKRIFRGVNHFNIERTRFLFFERDFWLRRTRFRISYRDFQRFLMSALPLGIFKTWIMPYYGESCSQSFFLCSWIFSLDIRKKLFVLKKKYYNYIHQSSKILGLCLFQSGNLKGPNVDGVMMDHQTGVVKFDKKSWFIFLQSSHDNLRVLCNATDYYYHSTWADNNLCT